MGRIKKTKPMEPEVLDEATVQAIEVGLQSEKSGDFMTMDQAVLFAKERREEWLSTPKATA